MEKLPIEFKQKWTAALRSGEYKQGHSSLYHYFNNSYCCIGVACVVAGIDLSTVGSAGYPYKSMNQIDLLPEVLVMHETEQSASEHNSLIWELIKLNDQKKASFAEIADYIDENL